MGAVCGQFRAALLDVALFAHLQRVLLFSFVLAGRRQIDHALFVSLPGQGGTALLAHLARVLIFFLILSADHLHSRAGDRGDSFLGQQLRTRSLRLLHGK